MPPKAMNNAEMFDFFEKSLSSAIMVSSDTSTEEILKILEEQERNDAKTKK